MFRRNLNSGSRGFTLIELAIVLGVVGVMSAGLWRLMSTGSQQTKDQATAQQQLSLITATQGFLADTSTGGGQPWLQTQSVNSTAAVPLPTSNTSNANCVANIAASFAKFCNYLPPGFSSATTNPYGQTYSIRVLTGAAAAQQNYSFMVVTTGTTAIPDTDGGRISSLIGGDGGFIYNSTTVCGGTAPKACGALGAWQVASIQAQYGYATSQAGAVASRSFVGTTTNSSNNWLARVLMPGDTAATPTNNTMVTPLFLGGQVFYMGSNSTSTVGGGSINLQGGTLTGSGTASALGLTGNTTLLQNMSVAGNNSALIVNDTNCPALNSTCADNAVLQTYGNMSVSAQLTVGSLYADTFVYRSSDKRLKKDIKPLLDPLAKIMKLSAVSFTYKANGEASMGLIAQDLEKVYPQLVGMSPKGFKAVSYDGLVAPLIGSVQELKKENDDLRNALRDQAARLDKMEQEIEILRGK